MEFKAFYNLKLKECPSGTKMNEAEYIYLLYTF